jgi:hypothetical protein
MRVPSSRRIPDEASNQGRGAAFETALQLHHELHRLRPPVPVVLALSRPQGVAELLADAKDAGALAHLEVSATMDKACSVEFLQGGSYEPLAEAIHERWRAQQISEGKLAMLWQDLADSLKASNRDQARDIVVKSTSIGCGFSPLRSWDARDFEFRVQEVEMLAIAEYDRMFVRDIPQFVAGVGLQAIRTGHPGHGHPLATSGIAE